MIFQVSHYNSHENKLSLLQSLQFFSRNNNNSVSFVSQVVKVLSKLNCNPHKKSLENSGI